MVHSQQTAWRAHSLEYMHKSEHTPRAFANSLHITFTYTTCAELADNWPDIDAPAPQRDNPISTCTDRSCGTHAGKHREGISPCQQASCCTPSEHTLKSLRVKCSHQEPATACFASLAAKPTIDAVGSFYKGQPGPGLTFSTHLSAQFCEHMQDLVLCAQLLRCQALRRLDCAMRALAITAC
jgi:hypothetical protein